MAKFKSGDVVQLQSGGLSMTVTDPEKVVHGVLTEDAKVVECVWFESLVRGGQRFRRAAFAEEMLKMAEE